MKRIWIHTYILLIMIGLFSACRKERDLSYQGATVVEFSNPITGTNTKALGASIGGGDLLGDNPSITIKGNRDSVLIQLVGPQRDAPIQVNYELLDGTAEEGVDFEIIGERGYVTIEPNTSSASIYLRLLNEDTDPSAVKNLQIRITDTDQADVMPSANYSTFSLSIFPMRVYLDRQLTADAPYFSLADGESYALPTGNTVALDFAYENGATPQLVSPEGRTTLFSQRLFTPDDGVPAHLQASHVTLQLNNATSTTINAIPESGTASNAVTANSASLVVNGVYAFKTTEGKKGYIRIKEGSTNDIWLFDVMFQP
ncbi:hypothetical protein H8S90_15650 [Olivibacter sp. SDN3]|uniref:hypothetical protein n=1 Tax=Olivibacter sp. SDN3 TaxID=2764720 RepID=UPI0016518C26|nr:hypothetical protein [Olivibacter sp. SDN3]QNL48230.1 hypothetical protein H8S90_15650 [Olivibacter sp. SDN3]